jgi:hypothetical protein
VAPRIKRRVTQLFNRSGAGCCLHIVVEDGNLRDDHVDFCIKEATDHRHSECEALARDIRALTEEQRKEVLGF